MSDPLVSIVVTTKNEESVLDNCLRSIKAQTYKNIDLIVVDNFSFDRTEIISKRYTQKFFSRGPERSAQRNFGLLYCAEGDFGMYIDADMILHPRVVECCLSTISICGLDALYVPEIVVGGTFFAKIRNHERQFYNGTVIDAVRFFSLDLFRRVGGFDEETFPSGSGEDWDLDRLIRDNGNVGTMIAPTVPPSSRLNSPIFMQGCGNQDETISIFHDESRISLWKYLEKKRYYGTAFDRYISKWGKEDPDIKKQFGFYYRYIKVFCEDGKWIHLVKFPHLSVLMYFLKIAVGINHLLRFTKRT